MSQKSTGKAMIHNASKMAKVGKSLGHEMTHKTMNLVNNTKKIKFL